MARRVVKRNFGTWNLLVNRDARTVAVEVIRLFQEEDLAWLAVQEAHWYYKAWTSRPDLVNLLEESGLKLVAKGDWDEAKEVFYVVREGVRVRNVRNAQVSNGWWARRTNRHKAGRSFLRATFAGWGRWGVLHYPAGTQLHPDGSITPEGREDDILACNASVTRFFAFAGRRAVLADWNRPLGNRRKNSPSWLADQIDVNVYGLRDGDIDYGLFKNMDIANPRSAVGFLHGSDHQPRIFTVRKRVWR